MFNKAFKPIINPYIINSPISAETLFFGRENDFKIIQNWIMRGSSQVILLDGARATGKTSILWQLLSGKLAEIGETIFCDFLAVAPSINCPEDIPLEIGKFILENEQFKKFSTDFLTDNTLSPTLRLQNLVEQCLEEISPRKLILLCDEFVSIESRFTHAPLSTESLLWAKKLLARSVYFIMTGDREFKDETINTVFASTLRKRLIHDLTLQDTLLLIKKPVEGDLTYKGEVPQMIYRLSGGHPFYTQYICHTLVNYVNLELKRNTVVPRDVNDVVDVMVRNPSDYLLEVWQSHWTLEASPPATKWVLAALANSLRKPNEYINHSALYKKAQKKRFAIEEKTLFETLAWLKHKTRLLDWQTEGYRFRIDLLRHWIAHTFQTVEDIDLYETKPELTVTKKYDGLEHKTFEENASVLDAPPLPLAITEKAPPCVETDVTTQDMTEAFSKESAYAEKLETLLQDEPTTEEVAVNDLLKEEAYDAYLGELETWLRAGATITVTERKLLDQRIEREHLDFEQALVVENRLREQLTLDFLDWRQEYETSCQQLQTQYAKKVPKTVLKDLYNTYVIPKRISKHEAKTIAQSFGFTWGIDTSVKKWFSQWFKKKNVTKELISPAEEIITEESQAYYTAYATQVETFLQDGAITTKERAELDEVIADHGLNTEQANSIENEVRKKLGLKPVDWVQEYRGNCYALKARYPHRTPRKELKNLKLYMAPGRVSRQKAEEIAQYVGLRAEWGGLYSWIAIAVGAIVIAILVLLQLVPLLTPVERIKPKGDVKGVQTSYREGDDIILTLSGSDNVALQRLQFSVSDTPIQESWSVSGQTVIQKASISTKDWEANRPYTYYYSVIDQADNEYRASGTFRLEESIPPTVEISGIEEKYTAGETIHYSVKAEDNLALKNMAFTVSSQQVEEKQETSEEIPIEEMRPEETPEELADKAERHYKEWDITDLQSSKQSSSFSTEGWQAGNYTYTLRVTDKVDNSTIQKGHFTLLVEDKIVSTPTDSTHVTVAPPTTPISTAEMNQLLQQCAEHFDANRLTTGRGGTALECYQQVLSRDANNATAKDGLQKIEDKYIRWTEVAINNRQTNKAADLLQRLQQVNPNSAALSRLETGLQQLQRTTRAPTSNIQSERSQSQNAPRGNTAPPPPRRQPEPARPAPSPMPENQLF